jgi:predicted negative regulator of RcsB-dependent stress response
MPHIPAAFLCLERVRESLRKHLYQGSIAFRAFAVEPRDLSPSKRCYHLIVRFRVAALAVVLLGVTCASASASDTIVLKNGRRIIATNVVEVGDRVTYDTPAGQMSIPKSIVDRIDRDGFAFNSSAAAAPPPVSAPEIEPVRGYEDISAKAVHDNAIDFSYLAQLETDARSGNRIAVDKATAAHYAAAQFLTAKGDTTAAVEQYRQGLSFAPDNMGLLLNLAVLYLRQSQFAAALDPLEHARRVDPDSADVAKLTGWAYYGANKMDLAVAEWKRAEKIHPDPDIEHALAKAERDKNEEESYREGETEHFVLKYSGSATPDLARGILRVLEDDFNDIESQLDFTPPEPIGVILYTDQTFADITRAPSWAGAINDGRIRIPVQGLTAVTPELARVLKHELTHSFVGQKTHSRAPTWLQEGVAQYMEGRRSVTSAGALAAAAGEGNIPSLASLEGSWLGLSQYQASFAYAWSLAAVESIVQSGGMSDVSRLLDEIASAPNTEEAMRAVLRSDYNDLQQQTLAYVRQQDLR